MRELKEKEEGPTVGRKGVGASRLTFFVNVENILFVLHPAPPKKIKTCYPCLRFGIV